MGIGDITGGTHNFVGYLAAPDLATAGVEQCPAIVEDVPPVGVEPPGVLERRPKSTPCRRQRQVLTPSCRRGRRMPDSFGRHMRRTDERAVDINTNKGKHVVTVVPDLGHTAVLPEQDYDESPPFLGKTTP